MSSTIVCYFNGDTLTAVFDDHYEIREFKGWKDNIFDNYYESKLISTVDKKIKPDDKHLYVIASYLFNDTYGGTIDNCVVLIPYNKKEGFAMHIIDGEVDIDFYFCNKSMKLVHISLDNPFHQMCKQLFEDYLSDVKMSMLCLKHEIIPLPDPYYKIVNDNLEIDEQGTITIQNENHFWNNESIFEILPSSLWKSVMMILICITKSINF